MEEPTIGKIDMLDGSTLDLASISLDPNKFMTQKVKVSDLMTNYSPEYQDAIIGKGSKNTQTIGDFSVLKRSIMQYGQIVPILVSKTSVGMFQVIDGLKRVIIAKRLGIEEINATVLVENVDVSSSVIRLISNQKVSRNIDGMMLDHDIVRNETEDLSTSFIETAMGLQSGDLEFLSRLRAMPEANRIEVDYRKGRIDLSSAKHKFDKLIEKQVNDDMNEDAKLKNDVLGDQSIEPDQNVLMANQEAGPQGHGIKDDDFDQQGLAGKPQEVTVSNEKEILTNGQQQFIGERHRLDKKLRAKVIERDHSTCQICGLGADAAFMRPQFEIHHLIEVQFGGHDEVDNLLTLCANCHKLITNHGVGDYKYVNPEYRQPDFDPTESELDTLPQYWGIMVLADIEKRGQKLSMNELNLDAPKIADLVRLNKMTIGQALSHEHLIVDFDFNPYKDFVEGVLKLGITKKNLGYEIINPDIKSKVNDFDIEHEYDQSSGTLKRIEKLVRKQ